MFFLMVGIKTVYIFVLIRILLNYFYFFFPILSMIFAMSATGCFIVGSLGAFSQFNIKRFLAYTSLNQLGFILLGLSSSLATIPYVLLFVIVYIVNNIIFFGVIFSLKNTDKHSFVFIEDLKGLSYFYPAESCFLSIALLSFIGMPPLAGFFSKFFILQNAIKAGFFFEVLFALLCNIVSGFYYLRIIKFI